MKDMAQNEEIRIEENNAPSFAYDEASADNINRLQAAAESILFAAGDKVSLDRLSKALNISKERTQEVLELLSIKYEDETSGICLKSIANGYQLCTKEQMYPYLTGVVDNDRKYQLTESVMETLSIIAYRQPVTRVEIEKIRGVSSDHAVNRLVDLGLVRELGRLDAPGKPLLFGTTDEFLRCFGISSKSDLPVLENTALEDFRQEATAEVYHI